MQKTDWTIHPSSPSYVVLDVTNRGQKQPFPCILDHLWHGAQQTTNDPSTSPLLTRVRKNRVQYPIFPAAVSIKSATIQSLSLDRF